MSYRCGIGAGMGLKPGGPVIICDGCGLEFPLDRGPRIPPAWFLDGKPPRGWRGLRMADGSRRWDLCPGCWKGDR